jgi:hypothetical protein
MQLERLNLMITTNPKADNHVVSTFALYSEEFLGKKKTGNMPVPQGII